MAVEFIQQERGLAVQIPSRWNASEVIYFSCYWLLFACVALGWIYGWYLVFIDAGQPDTVPPVLAILAFCAWLIWLIVSPFWLSSMFWPVLGNSTLEVGGSELTHRWKAPLLGRQRAYPTSKIAELRVHHYRTFRYSAFPWAHAGTGLSVRSRDFQCDRATIKFHCEGKTHVLPLELDVQEAEAIIERIGDCRPKSTT